MRRFLGLALFAFAATASAANWYISPTGSGSACTAANPCSRATAFNMPAIIHAGDVIWALPGTYTGTVQSHLMGTAASPIIVRNYQNGRVTFDGGNSNQNSILFVVGDYTWFWGIEIMSSNACRQSSIPGEDPNYSPCLPLPGGRGNAITTQQLTGSAVGTRFINCILHDARENDVWIPAVGAEFYGNIVYYNGWNASDRGHGHGLYTQNQTGIKKIWDNIFFSGFGHGIHAYGSSSAYLDNFDIQGNTFSSSGNLATQGPSRNLLLGGGRKVHNAVISSNYAYYPPGGPQTAFNFGYSAGCEGPNVVMNNYFAQNTAFVNCAPTNVSGNTFYGSISGFTQGQYPSNTYTTTRPTVTKVFIEPNNYEPGRANVTIFNWQGTATVAVDLTTVLTIGSSYEIRNAQNFYGGAVGTGVYAGGTVNFPTTALTPATPVGWPAPAATGPDFNVYVVLTTSGQPSPTPTNTPSVTFTPSHTKTKTPTATRTSSPTKTLTPTITNTAIPGATNTFTYTPSNTATKTFTPTATPTQGAVWHTQLPLGDAVIVSPLPIVNTYGIDARTVTTYGFGTATWTFNVPYPSTVDFWAYCNATSPNSDSFYVSVDGGAEITYDTAEGVWQPAFIWTTVCNRAGSPPVPCAENPVYWTLAAGSHTVRFRGREVGSQIADLYVSSDPGFIPQITPTPTFTPSFTATQSPTATFTPSPSNTPESVCFTVTPSNTPTPSPTP